MLEPPPIETPTTPRPRRRRLEPLPRGVRLFLFVIGGLLVAVGLIGLALPIVPQVIPLVLGAAILSLASDALYLAAHRLLRRWPSVARRFRDLRSKIHGMVSRSGR